MMGPGWSDSPRTGDGSGYGQGMAPGTGVGHRTGDRSGNGQVTGLARKTAYRRVTGPGWRPSHFPKKPRLFERY